MYNLLLKIFKIGVVFVVLFICYNLFISKSPDDKFSLKYDDDDGDGENNRSSSRNEYNIWIIFTKVQDKSPLIFKFKNMVLNMLNISSVVLRFHVFIDDNSREIAIEYFKYLSNLKNRNISCSFYDVNKAATAIEDIVSAMTPYFSSRPGTYYSGALFYLSLGLYKIAPHSQERAIMLDCDLYFKDDVALLFNEFKRFDKGTLFGLAPELSPVYRHVLHTYRTKHKTSFGEYYHPNAVAHGPHPRGYQGYNSGVILLNLAAQRKSKDYPKLLMKEAVSELATKYNFRGHLGDQDFYTLLGYEHPNLIQTLNCGFNKQLCTWWRDNGYKEVFDFYAKCEHKIVVVHGNCNTRISNLK